MTDAVLIEGILEKGREALSENATLDFGSFGEPKVCFHFSCPDDEKNDRWGEDAEGVRISRDHFNAMPFELSIDGVGGSVGIEAWEMVTPDNAWLEDRIPRMLEIAHLSRMNFDGWSFEPRNGPIVSAGVNVLSAYSPEGSAVIESLKATKH